MPGFLFGLGLFVAAGLLARLLVYYFSNRPDATPDYTPEEILGEIDDAFVHREAITFHMSQSQIRPFLNRLTEAVSIGFTQQQANTLVKRMLNDPPYNLRAASYAVDVDGVASDIEFQWVRGIDAPFHIALAATAPILAVARAALANYSIKVGT